MERNPGRVYFTPAELRESYRLAETDPVLIDALWKTLDSPNKLRNELFSYAGNATVVGIRQARQYVQSMEKPSLGMFERKAFADLTIPDSARSRTS
ncbi:MAG: hypothetical protein IJL43_01375 [Lachnospiraceae bacterium]|nr:hypothetical protein [Lachnospiraceae bacterium]